VRLPRIALVALTLVGGCSDHCGPTPEPHLSWRRSDPLHTPRTEVAAAGADERVVVAGGFDGEGATVPTVEIRDGTGPWSSGPDLPRAVDHAAAASDGTSVYVFGGYDAQRTPTDGAYVLRGRGWVKLPPMPEGRAAGGAAFAGGRFWIVGGIGPRGLADRTMVFKPASGRWEFAPGLQTPREHLGVTAEEPYVYAVGGRVGGRDHNLAVAERFHVPTGEWASLPDLPTPRGGLAAAAGRGFVFAIGGEGAEAFDEVEAYDLVEMEWTTFDPLPTARHGLGVVVVEPSIYVLAGGPQPGLTVSGKVDVGPLPAAHAGCA
jgi:Kelch motif protein